MIRIIGIDPGLAKIGFGIIDSENNKYVHVAHGTLPTDSSDSTDIRLDAIYKGLCSILTKYKPEEAGVESLFFSKNISSALPVAQARGVIILALKHCEVKVFNYSPLAIKMSVTGSGSADKHQMQQMVKIILGLKKISDTDHSADALAAAVCHLNNRGSSFLKQLEG